MRKSRILMSALVAGFALNAVAVAADMSSVDKTQVEGVVHDYILKNPEVIVQALQSFQQKEMLKARQNVQQTQLDSPKFANALFHNAADPVAGNTNGKMAIVEFFDYQCGHCIEMAATIDSLIAANPDLKVIFKEFPIRGPMSEVAARAALAAQKQGLYFQFHKSLMSSKQEPLTEAGIYDIAKAVGLDLELLKTDMKSKAIDQQIQATRKLAQDLKLMGTPALFVAKSDANSSTKATAIAFIPGQVDQGQMEQIMKQILSGKPVSMDKDA